MSAPLTLVLRQQEDRRVRKAHNMVFAQRLRK
jgi:hypothetical protein